MPKIKHLLIVGLLLRLVVMAWLYHPDLKSQYFHAQFLSQGVTNIYQYIADHKASLPYTDSYNYPPFTFFTQGLWFSIARLFSGSGLSTWLNDWGPNQLAYAHISTYLLVLKLPYLFAELAVIYLFTKLLPNPEHKYSFLALSLLNPVSLYAIFALGQFDILPALGTVLALYFTAKSHRTWALVCIMLAVFFKTYPLLLVPFILLRCKSLSELFKQGILVLGISVLFIGPFFKSPAFIASFFQSSLGQRILSAQIGLGGGEELYLFFASYVIFLCVSWQRKNSPDLLPEFLSTTLAVVFFAQYHAQWLVWSAYFIFYHLARHPQDALAPLLGLVGFFCRVFLLADQFVLVGLFSALNPSLLLIPPLSTNAIIPTSMFHTVFIAAGLYLITSVWSRYVQKPN